MRDGVDAPTETVSEAELARLRAYLDRQGPISLAVWVRHAHTGPDGPSHDHHTMLGMDDGAYARADLRALDRGVWEECPAPGWIDVFPLSEVDPLRAVGDVLWERGEEPADALDPLDFRLTHEPVELPAESVHAFADLVRAAAPGIVRVDATYWRLWKGDCERDGGTSLYVGCDLRRSPPPGPLELVVDAARRAGIPRRDSSLGPPREPPPYATVLYDAGSSA